MTPLTRWVAALALACCAPAVWAQRVQGDVKSVGFRAPVQTGDVVRYGQWFPILVELNADYPFRNVVDLLTGYGEEIAVSTLDMLPSFMGLDASELWVSAADQHPNAAGHAVAAESLYPFVVELLESGGG